MHLNLDMIKKTGTIVKFSVICTIVIPPIMFDSDFGSTVSRTAHSSLVHGSAMSLSW